MKYFEFSGKVQRSEFWATSIILFVLFFICIVSATAITAFNMFIGIIAVLATIVASAWAQMAVIAKRCRDAGINPWWTAACYIPYLGFIIWIVIGCLSTDKEVQA
jgi:uncharacterized membrane protein YhaH (DUF805 family)